jgi:hypothetical protein
MKKISILALITSLFVSTFALQMKLMFLMQDIIKQMLSFIPSSQV